MPKQALYLKWRPQEFDDLIGQEHIVRTLLNSIDMGRVRHAYLFSGPRGTGKTTTARLLAKALGCRDLDLIEIDAASHTGVDDVRDLRDKIAFLPTVGQYKVYIIDEVHRFSRGAFDALLKTLEEPPAHAIFVLATTEIDKVPDTIKSRCLQFEFRRVSTKEVADRLEQIALSEEIQIERAALELIARQGTGSVRDSISLLDQIVTDPHEFISLELAQRILGTANVQAVLALSQAMVSQDVVRGLQVIDEAIDSGTDPRQLAQQLVEYLRNLLLVKVANANLVEASADMRKRLEQQAQALSRSQIIKMIRSFQNAFQELKGSGQPQQLALELALMESLQANANLADDVPAVKVSTVVDSLEVERVIEQVLRQRFAHLTTTPSSGHVATPEPRSEQPPDGAIDTNQPPLVALATLRNGWAETRRGVDVKNRILAALMEHADVVGVSGNLVSLSTKGDFYFQQLSKPENRSLIQYVLSRQHNQSLVVQLVGTDGWNKESNSISAHDASTLLNIAQREFGANVTPFNKEDKKEDR